MSNPPFVYQPRIKKVDEQAQQQIYLLLHQLVEVRTIARMVGHSEATIRRLRTLFGITHYYRRLWTPEDDWELRNMVDNHWSIYTMAKKLVRTPGSIHSRITDLGINRVYHNRNTYTVAQVARIVGVSESIVNYWVSHYKLRSTRIKMKDKNKNRHLNRIYIQDLYDWLVDRRHWHLYTTSWITDDALRHDVQTVQREHPWLLQTTEVAARYAVTTSCVNLWCSTGIIPHERIGKYYLFDPELLRDWIPPCEKRRGQYGYATIATALVERPYLLTAQQIASRYGVSVTCIHQWCRRHGMPYVSISRSIRMFDPDQLVDWIAPNDHERRRKNAAYRSAASCDRPCHDRDDEPGRLARGAAPDDGTTETDPQPGGGCESSTVPELEEATK